MAAEKQYLIVKRDLYYRPKAMGYTGIKDEAGRYSLDEVAVLFPNLESENQDGMSFIAEDEAPDYSPACWHDVKARHMAGKLEAAQQQITGLSTALDALMETSKAEIDRLTAENERLRNMTLTARFAQVFAGSHRHLKSGGLYDHIGTGRIQSDEPLTDMDAVEIYIGVGGDLWARRQSEFHDGRFSELVPAP